MLAWQEQTATLLFARQMLLGPHGDGLQGFTGCTGAGVVLQKVKASPFIPGGHEHAGIWFITLHKAFWPHVPGQGSTHLFRIHAFVGEHSVLKTHSGRQPE